MRHPIHKHYCTYKPEMVSDDINCLTFKLNMCYIVYVDRWKKLYRWLYSNTSFIHFPFLTIEYHPAKLAI